ncbi:DUF3592 domain-containing protein [uncultured Desulfosarcina sp.]|uniref:DUF3592 domain-containing protein n=1 Tax=uncultured Desulfosarcina sp. TaxID=218289 RepID=UPI0029C7FD8F|nr:DUF3592 domain-containing protein [uncultured Desulfosarcina sp.]
MNSPKALQTNKSKSRFIHLSGVSGKADRGMLFLILGMFVAGVVMMAWGGLEIKGSRESGSWPTAQGTISSSSVSKRTTRDSNHRTKTTYYPKVGYHYQAEGRKYSSTRIAFGVGESGGSMKWAQKIVNKYPVGKSVAVYYNPAIRRPRVRHHLALDYSFIGRDRFFHRRRSMCESQIKEAEASANPLIETVWFPLSGVGTPSDQVKTNDAPTRSMGARGRMEAIN